MSTSKIPPLQPHPSRKKKRKYTNWATQLDGGLTWRQRTNRASLLAANTSKLKNDAISSNTTLPACTSNQESQTPISSSSYLHSGDENRCCKGATSDTLAEESCSGSMHTKQRLCSGQRSGESVQQSGTQDKIESGSNELADIQFEVSTEIHNNILPYVNKLHDHRNMGVQLDVNTQLDANMGVQSVAQASRRASMLAKKNDAISSNVVPPVPLPACTSGQQSQTPINFSSFLHYGDCNHVCEYCCSYFWHGQRVKSFPTKRQPTYIRCCKGATSVAEESCSGSTLTKQRLFSGSGSGESVQQPGTKDEIESGSSELPDIQFEVSTEIHNHILPYVNKLRDYRNRGQNAVFFDGQDRLVKVVSFVSSLLDNIKNPILIIASSSALMLWKMEFSNWSKWSKWINVVTYKGTKDVRAAIRGSKFQVLLSSPEIIVEDIETLDHIKWELLVIDECQRLVISMHLKKIQRLVADMKLLTVSCEPVDTLQSFRNILSLADCKNEKIYTDADMEMNDDISTLKERLSPFIAFECKFSTLDLEEYWVPVHLSSMQIKQYCSILVSNSDALSSVSRTSSLNDIITQIQKCCDHPYLMDPTLRNSPKEPSLNDPLAAEINVSGKLHVFDKLLLEIKRRGLRALVLFHSAVSSEKISTEHFLEDLVHKRFGESSYVYIPGWILSHSALVKKKESLEMFNKAESDRFICLCDHRACLSSLRLSHVDVVILFNSGLNPSNDIKALEGITFDSHCERLKVFRLYSAFTVQEKALLLSKQGTAVDSYIGSSVCHQLLAWGATYLFSKLQSSTDSGPQLFIDDLVLELSSLLRNTSVETGPTNLSIISHAQMQNGAYSGSILLFGETESHTKESSSIDEYLIDNRYSVFWSNMVKQNQPGTENLVKQSQPGTENLVKQSQPGTENSCSRLSPRVQKSTRNEFKETSSVNILHIPASALIPPKNPCSTSGPTTYTGSGLRAPAHLRSNSSTFAAFRNRHATGGSSLEPLPTWSTAQTLPCI